MGFGDKEYCDICQDDITFKNKSTNRYDLTVCDECIENLKRGVYKHTEFAVIALLKKLVGKREK